MSEHVITVHKIPGEDGHDFLVKSCPADSRCLYWLPCERCDPALLSPSKAEEDAGAYFAHGEQHEAIEGEWATNTGRCALELDGGRAGLFDFAYQHGPGIFEVSVGYWGDGVWEVDHLRTLTRPRQLIHHGKKPPVRRAR